MAGLAYVGLILKSFEVIHTSIHIRHTWVNIWQHQECVRISKTKTQDRKREENHMFRVSGVRVHWNLGRGGRGEGPRVWGRENWFHVPTKDGFWSHRVNQYVTSCMKDSDKCTCTLIYLLMFWSTLIILTQTESGHLQAFHFSWGSKSRILRWRFRLGGHCPLVSLHLNLAMTN